jgi:hypothetical protein
MIEAAAWVLTACLKGNIICIRDAPSPKLVFREPEKSCYVDGIFYPRCKDYDNPEVKHYHNLLKEK